MTNLLKKLFPPAKGCSVNKMNPAEQLWHDIKIDYWKDEDNKCKYNETNKGCLNNEFSTNHTGVKLDLFYDKGKIPSNEAFSLNYKDCENNLLFGVFIKYGYITEIPTNTVLYLHSFERFSNESFGFGKQIAMLITQFAENRKFDYIWVNPVACENSIENAMNQNELEDFYIEAFKSELVKIQYVDVDASRLSEVDF